MRGRPLWSSDGRGPSFTLGVIPAARSRSRNEGRADWVDMRTSSEGRGNSSRILRYLERPELDSVDLGDAVAGCGSLGSLGLSRDGGGRRSGEDFSGCGEATGGGGGGGTTVASDF